MKYLLTIFVVGFTISSEAIAEIHPSFGLQPGTRTMGAQGGIRLGKWTPLIGLDFSSASTSMDFTYTDYGSSETETGSLNMSFSYFLPRLGVKYAFISGKSQPYLKFLVGKSFATGKMKSSYSGLNSEEQEDKEKIEEAIGDVLQDLIGKLWVVNLVFGAEYFIDDYLSFSGEFGYLYSRTGASLDLDLPDSFYLKGNGNFSIGETYTALWINFYFGTSK